MPRAGKVGLRARDEADVAVLHAAAASPYAVSEPRDDEAVFPVVELADGELAGEAPWPAARRWYGPPRGPGSYTRAGSEGAAWVSGEFADEVILGMLAADWDGGGSRQSGEDAIADRSS